MGRGPELTGVNARTGKDRPLTTRPKCDPAHTERSISVVDHRECDYIHE